MTPGPGPIDQAPCTHGSDKKCKRSLKKNMIVYLCRQILLPLGYSSEQQIHLAVYECCNLFEQKTQQINETNIIPVKRADILILAGIFLHFFEQIPYLLKNLTFKVFFWVLSIFPDFAQKKDRTRVPWFPLFSIYVCSQSKMQITGKIATSSAPFATCILSAPSSPHPQM